MNAAPASFRLPDLLVRRMAWLTGLSLLLAAGLDLRHWQQRQGELLPATADLVARYLADDLGRRVGSFDRSSIEVRLQDLAPLAQRLPFCVAVHDIHQRPLSAACLPHGDAAAWSRGLAQGLGTAVIATRTLTLPGGITVGTLEVSPHWQAEVAVLMRGWTAYALLLLVSAVMVMSVWLTARRALQPAAQVLEALHRVADGDTAVRLPRQGFAEFDRIAIGLNQALESVDSHTTGQRQLAAALLHTREAERRRLARELHDELGQSLAALGAEATVLRQLLGEREPAAQASTRAIGELSARMLDELQRVLADLRPASLDRFGLRLALQSLVDQPRPRPHGPALVARLAWDPADPAAWVALPHDGDMHVYRIVQEGLTNAWRHGQASQVDIQVCRSAARVEVHIEQAASPVDAPADAAPPPTRRSAEAAGDASGAPSRQPQGLAGIRERARALGGDAQWWADRPGDDRGWRVLAHWPLAAAGGEGTG